MAVVLAVAFFLALLVVKLLWAWTVPELCPKAVSEGYVAGSISWYASFKLTIVICISMAVGVMSVRRSGRRR